MSIRHTSLLLLITGFAAAGVSAAPGSSEISWGKAGVSLEDYAVDSGLCAYRAMMLDVSDTREARRLVAATRRLEHLETSWGTPAAGNQWLDHRRTVEAVRPELIFERIAELQQQTLNNCLVERGYRQFRLTDEQQRQLRRLEPGSSERRAFLHRLGSDPAVLRRQGSGTATLTPPQG